MSRHKGGRRGGSFQTVVCIIQNWGSMADTGRHRDACSGDRSPAAGPWSGCWCGSWSCNQWRYRCRTWCRSFGVRVGLGAARLQAGVSINKRCGREAPVSRHKGGSGGGSLQTVVPINQSWGSKADTGRQRDACSGDRSPAAGPWSGCWCGSWSCNQCKCMCRAWCG